MAHGKRVAGFVVGNDKKAGRTVWKVRVKDQASVHDEGKFEVVSKHPGTEPLNSSDDVTFRIEPLQVAGEIVLRAVDVAVGPVDTESKRKPDCEPSSEGSRTLNVCVTVDYFAPGEVCVFTTGLENEEQARRDLDSTEGEVIAFCAIDLAPSDLPAESRMGLDIIDRLSCIDGPRDGLDYLLGEAFKLGLSCSKPKP